MFSSSNHQKQNFILTSQLRVEILASPLTSGPLVWWQPVVRSSGRRVASSRTFFSSNHQKQNFIARYQFQSEILTSPLADGLLVQCQLVVRQSGCQVVMWLLQERSSAITIKSQTSPPTSQFQAGILTLPLAGGPLAWWWLVVRSSSDTWPPGSGVVSSRKFSSNNHRKQNFISTYQFRARISISLGSRVEFEVSQFQLFSFPCEQRPVFISNSES